MSFAENSHSDDSNEYPQNNPVDDRDYYVDRAEYEDCDLDIRECQDCAFDDEQDVDPGEMDGDHQSGLASAGWGTDEDYGSYDDDRDDRDFGMDG